MSLSNNIDQMSTDVPLGIGLTYESGGLYLGEYASLDMLAFASHASTVVYEFSGDNVNWDSATTLTLVAGTPQNASLVIIGKYVRVTVTNTSGILQTALRVFTYGSVDNITLQATAGGTLPSINVSNFPLSAYKEVSAVEMTPLIQYEFTRGVTGLAMTETWNLPYSDLHSASNNLAVRLDFLIGDFVSTADVTPTRYGAFWGRNVSLRVGQGMRARFSAYWVQSGKKVPGGNSIGLVGVGNFDTTLADINCMAAFGYGDFALPEGPTAFGVYYQGGPPSSAAGHVRQASWNLDKADGTGVLPVMNTWELFNQFEITYLCGAIFYAVMNPNTGRFVAVHTITQVNISTFKPFSEFPFGMLTFMDWKGGVEPVETTDLAAIGSFMLAVEGKSSPNYDRFSTAGSIISFTTETEVLGIRCNPTFYPGGRNQFSSIGLDFLAYQFDGSASHCQIILYRNRTRVGTTFTDPHPLLIPVAEESNWGAAINPGIILFQLPTASQGHQVINLEPYYISLSRGDTLTITGTTIGGNQDLYCSIGYHLNTHA